MSKIQTNPPSCVIKLLYYPHKQTECFSQDTMHASSESPEQVTLRLGLVHTLED